MRRTSSMLEKLQNIQAGIQAKEKMRALRNDFTVLKNIWFKKLADTDDHAERLEQFYGPQAHACEFVISDCAPLVITFLAKRPFHWRHRHLCTQHFDIFLTHIQRR